MSESSVRTPVTHSPVARSPIAHSPITPAPPVVVIDGWEVSGARATGALTLGDCAPVAKVQLKAAPDGAAAGRLAVSFGRASRDSGGVLVVGAGPGEWLFLGAAERGPELRQRAESLAAGNGGLASVVDLTHGRALVRLTGGAAAGMLAKVCGIDLCDDIFPDGAAARTSVAGVATDLIRDDQGGVLSYLLHCERSSGQYLFDELLRAGTEFSIEITGFNPPGI